MSKPRVVTITLSAALAAVSLAAVSGPSQAQSPKKGTAPAEAGCYDVLAGWTGGLLRSVVIGTQQRTVAISHPVDLQTPAEHDHTTVIDQAAPMATSAVDAAATLTTAAAAGEDCSAVRYRLRIVGEANRFITELVVPGRTGPKVELTTTFEDALLATDTDGTRYAFFSVTTENTNGQVADTAPDAVEGARADLTGGGATSYGG